MRDYPKNISREQFETIRTDLERARKKTRPRKTDLYDVFLAILYLIKHDIPWKALPANFPKCHTVYYYYSIWRKPDKCGVSPLEKALEKIGC